ncbi:MAG: hypothetical protein QM736_29550 [Vicinamibacterales bacterium]
MRIVVDARAYFMRTGMARYTRAMVKALYSVAQRTVAAVVISDHHVPGDVGWLGPSVGVQVSQAPWLGGARERRQLEAETAAWRGDRFYSIFFPTGGGDLRAERRYRVRPDPMDARRAAPFERGPSVSCRSSARAAARQPNRRDLAGDGTRHSAAVSGIGASNRRGAVRCFGGAGRRPLLPR